MKHVRRALLAIHLFVGIGAVGGGMAAILNPQAPMKIPASMLKNSPFTDFLIPGIILFAFIGLGNIACAALFRFRWKYQGYASSVFSWGLVIWIVVQCVMLQAVAFLHVLFFGIGLVMAGLSMALLFEQRLFPANLLYACYSRITGKGKAA